MSSLSSCAAEPALPAEQAAAIPADPVVAAAEPDHKGELYGPHCYMIPPQKLAELRELQPWRPVVAAALAWLCIFALVKGFLYFPEAIYLYPLVVLLIAGRAGVFLQLAHEAGHGLIARGKFNDWFGKWIATYPIGLDLKGYREPHLRHHACVNQKCDPLSDSEKYRITDVRNPRLWLLFLKDALGLTALTIRFQYEQPVANKYKDDIKDYLETREGYVAYQAASGNTLWLSFKKYASIALMQTIILGALFSFNVVHYLLLWIVPLITAHMVLMRIRGIAEHGLGLQRHEDVEKKTKGMFYTRSFGTPMNRYWFTPLLWLERALIGSLDVYYHHEHHLYPKVPYYNLHKVHALVAEQVHKNNPEVYAPGYFVCLFYNLRHGKAQAVEA